MQIVELSALITLNHQQAAARQVIALGADYSGIDFALVHLSTINLIVTDFGL